MSVRRALVSLGRIQFRSLAAKRQRETITSRATIRNRKSTSRLINATDRDCDRTRNEAVGEVRLIIMSK